MLLTREAAEESFFLPPLFLPSLWGVWSIHNNGEEQKRERERDGDSGGSRGLEDASKGRNMDGSPCDS